ncbi:uncharacterized protein LOC136025946 [Artemia franciscana]|uniref:uncharacterized protein LOC136025946 n=1 Tax=Artemia franciscana TaxID=6661 RepID=UPI0032DBB212
MVYRIGILVSLLSVWLQISPVVSHGRLMDPPARNSMWRFGFPSPVDYNDNELYCGGRGVQFGVNDGKCGVCGNDYRDKVPRPHEMNGLYYSGLNTRRYAPGQVLNINIDLTANHWGYFELKLCPSNYDSNKEMQACFDKYPLRIAGTNTTRYEISKDTPKKGTFKYRIQLPPKVTCSHCIIQWTYYTGNTWGICPDGTGAVGCGNQETFVNCADVSIVSGSGSRPGPATEENPFQLYVSKDGQLASPPLSPGQEFEPLVVDSQVCLATGKYKGNKKRDEWCMTNCLKYPPNCPQSRCKCITDCVPIGGLERIKGTDVFCHINCLRYPQDKCPTDKCSCS